MKDKVQKKLETKVFFGMALFAAVILSCWFIEGRHIVMKVGDFKIYDKDVIYRNQIIKMNYPDEKKDFGLLQLQKSYTNYQILRNHNYTAIEERLKNESERIDQKTKNPEMLKKIKEIFGKDLKAYQRVLVIPAAVDETIYYNFFNQLDSLQKESQNKSEKILAELKSTKESLKEKAAKENLAYKMIQVERFNRVLPMDLNTLKTLKLPESIHKKEKKLEDPMSKYWIDTVLQNVKVGELVSDIISLEDIWIVAKLYKKINKDVYQVEIIEIPKKNFSQFIEEESKKIPVKTGFFIF